MSSINPAGGQAIPPVNSAITAETNGIVDKGKAVLGAVTNVASKPFNAFGAFSRHGLDSVVFSQPSERWNGRNAYRTEYGAEQRFGADMGDAAMVALPLMGAALYKTKGSPIPLITGTGTAAKVGTKVGQGAAYLALTAMTALSAKKVIEHVSDNGDLAPVLAPALGMGGAIVAGKMTAGSGKVGNAMAMAGAFIAGAAAGGIGGNFIKVGESKLGEEHVKEFTPADSLPGKAVEFVRGANNHFGEDGPGSQGVSFGTAWHQRDAFQSNYSEPEQAGGMAGDLLAASLMGGGALATIGAMNSDGVARRVANIDFTKMVPVSRGMLQNRIAAPMNAAAAIDGATGIAKHAGKVNGAAAAMAAAVVGHQIYANSMDENGDHSIGRVAATAALAGGAYLGMQAIARKAPVNQALAGIGSIRPAIDTVTAIALFSALSAAQAPARSFIDDARDVWSQADGDKAKKVAMIAAPIAAIGGGLLGAKIGGKIGTGNLYKIGGAVAGAGIAAGVGAGLAPVLPGVPRDADKVAEVKAAAEARIEARKNESDE